MRKRDRFVQAGMFGLDFIITAGASLLRAVNRKIDPPREGIDYIVTEAPASIPSGRRYDPLPSDPVQKCFDCRRTKFGVTRNEYKQEYVFCFLCGKHQFFIQTP